MPLTKPFCIRDHVQTAGDLRNFAEALQEDPPMTMDPAVFAELLESVKQMDAMVRAK